MATRKIRSARKTSTTRKTAAAPKNTAATPAAEPTTPEMEDASAKLNALLNTEEQENSKEESTPTSDADKQDADTQDAAPAAAAATPAAAPAAAPAVKVKKVKLLPGQIDPSTAPPLGTDEFDIEIDGPGDTGKIIKRFRKPKDGRWVVSASARNARMWHVIDLDADDATRVLCTLVHTKWVGGRQDRDPQTKCITCPFCLVRALASGMTTEQEQAEIAKKEIEAKKEAQRQAREAKKEAAAAKLAANTAATAAASTAAATAAAASPDQEEADSAQAAGDEAATEAA